MTPAKREQPTAEARRSLARSLSQIAEEAAEIPLPYLRALTPVLVEAKRELARDLARWLDQAPSGDARFTAQRYRQALVAIESALDVIGKRLPVELEGALLAQGDAAAALSVTHLRREILLFSAHFGVAVRPVSFDTAAILAKGRRLLIPRYRTSAARYVDNIRDDIKRQLAIGRARNETFDELTLRLQRHGGPRGVVALRGVVGEPRAVVENIAEGLFRRYWHWAERIVRTEGLNAYNVHHLNGLITANREDPGYTKRWDASIDGRTCKICRDLDGTVLELGDRFDVGREDDARLVPPAHPNCRCALTPWRKEWDPAFRSRDYPTPEPVPAYKPNLDVTRFVRVADLAAIEWMGIKPQIRDRGRAREARSKYHQGQTPPPMQVTIAPSGRMEIVDGVHRYVVARDEFPDAVIPVRFAAGV